MVDLKYLFSVLVFCMSLWAVLLLWVMVVLVGVVGFLGLRAFTVDHKMWPFFFWSQSDTLPNFFFRVVGWGG